MSDTRSVPFRLQVALSTPEGSFLQLEVIAEAEAFFGWGPGEALRERLDQAKWRAGKPLGGSVLQRADLPRTWDVPVGARIPPGGDE